MTFIIIRILISTTPKMHRQSLLPSCSAIACNIRSCTQYRALPPTSWIYATGGPHGCPPPKNVRSRGILSLAGMWMISNLNMHKFCGGLHADCIASLYCPGCHMAPSRPLLTCQQQAVWRVNCIPEMVVPSSDRGISSACRWAPLAATCTSQWGLF